MKDTTQPWKSGKQVVGLMINQPNIEINELSKIKAKVLIIAGDKDVIKNEHTVEIQDRTCFISCQVELAKDLPVLPSHDILGMGKRSGHQSRSIL